MTCKKELPKAVLIRHWFNRLQFAILMHVIYLVRFRILVCVIIKPKEIFGDYMRAKTVVKHIENLFKQGQTAFLTYRPHAKQHLVIHTTLGVRWRH